MKPIIILLMVLILTVGAGTIRAEESSSVITLQQAQTLALEKNPELAAFSLEIQAKDAVALQAGLLPNPEINISMENFGGSKDLSGFEGTETTFELGQMIELGGKRSKRKNAALLERDLAKWDYEAKRADVVADVTKSFVDVLAAQEAAALKEELVRLAEQIDNVISVRVASGKVSPVEETKAGIALSFARIESEKAKRDLDARRKKLEGFWGSAEVPFARVAGNLYEFSPIPLYDQLVNAIQQNPDIARWSSETEQKNAVIKLEESKRITDPTVSFGLRNLRENKTNAFVAGISLPLPLFNRNQGGILEARQRLAQTGEQQKNARLRILTAISETYQNLSSYYTESSTLKAEVLPGAHSAFEAAQEGYRQGKFNYLEVLDSQRTLFEAKNRYIEVLAAYHKALADIKRLAGERIDMITNTSEERL